MVRPASRVPETASAAMGTIAFCFRGGGEREAFSEAIAVRAMAGGDDRKNFALEPYEVKSMKQLRLFAAVCAALLAVAAPAAGLEKPKYIFLFIGDGMGAPQVSLAAEFCGKPQLFDGFETVGLTATRSLNSYITDSAAAGTAARVGEQNQLRHGGPGAGRDSASVLCHRRP